MRINRLHAITRGEANTNHDRIAPMRSESNRSLFHDISSVTLKFDEQKLLNHMFIQWMAHNHWPNSTNLLLHWMDEVENFKVKQTDSSYDFRIERFQTTSKYTHFMSNMFSYRYSVQGFDYWVSHSDHWRQDAPWIIYPMLLNQVDYYMECDAMNNNNNFLIVYLKHAQMRDDRGRWNLIIGHLYYLDMLPQDEVSLPDITCDPFDFLPGNERTPRYQHHQLPTRETQ